MNYKSLYIKSEDQITCCGCGVAYHSERGIYHHLQQTVCGFGSKEKTQQKKDLAPFYKVENNIFSCLVCGVNYDTIRGMHYHLKKKCGVDAKLKVFTPKPQGAGDGEKKISPEKRNYQQFYRKEEDSLICLGCESIYQSTRGIHRHLITTKCGFGDRFRSPPKTSYLELYRKEGDLCVCRGCERVYNSSRGVHHHLNSTTCGFGDKESSRPRTNYTPMYNKVGEWYECKRCDFKAAYRKGLHRHLETCVAGFLEELGRLAELEKMDLTNIKHEAVDELNSTNTNAEAGRKVFEELRNWSVDKEAEFDKMSTATEEEFCDGLVLSKDDANSGGDHVSSNLTANFGEFDLD